MDTIPHASWYQLKRVKHCLKKKRREAVIDQLRKHNADLRRCLQMSNSEMTAEDDNPIVQDLIKRFRIKDCNTLRLRLASLHRALASGPRCAYLTHIHQIALDLEWHLGEPAVLPGLNLALSYRDTAEGTPQSAPCWRKLHATHKPATPANPATTIPVLSSSILSGPSTPPRTPSPLRSLPGHAQGDHSGYQTRPMLQSTSARNSKKSSFSSC